LAKLVRKSKHTEPDFLPNTIRIAEYAAEHKARDIKAYDLRGLTVIADVFVICSAEGDPSVGWLLIDFGNIVVHVFREKARAFYDLDGLWGDAPEIELGIDE
jgi:ribosome-associated protein